MNEDLESKEARALFSENFLHDLSEILGQNDLKHFSPLKFYWTSLIDNFVYISQLHQDLSSNINKKQNKIFQQIEEEIFDFWNDSDLVDIFKNFLEEGRPVEDCSLKSLMILEDQILCFYYLHISTLKFINFDKTIYLPLENIGESKNKIYLRNMKSYIELPNDEDTLVSFENLNLNKKEILFYIDEELESCPVLEAKHIIINKNLKLVNGVSFAQKFKDALSVLEVASIDLFKCVNNFSEFFIPAHEPEIVSYSMQSLPRFSSINIFNRDFLDLLDDITHENGHHYLNAILNQEELLIEDDEKIYFSPWRKSLRPIRGIYHGVFTFFFALKLYVDLKNNFSKKEIQAVTIKYHDLKYAQEKINKRIVEEYQMINLARNLLNHAEKHKKINPKGSELISAILKLVDSFEGDYKDSVLTLKDEGCHSAFFESLQNLEEKSKHYNL